MPTNAVAENIFGTIGTICWSGQLVPQVWKSWREQSTEGLSHWMVLLWGISAAFLGVYAIVQNLNIPLIVQPQLFGFLCFLSWGQCQYYGQHRSKRVASMITISVMLLVGGFEVGMVFAITQEFNRGNLGPVRAFGILSTVILAVALLPQYWEILRRREVVGISLVFMTIDALGGVFSDLSLVFKTKFDILAEWHTVLDVVILIAAIVLNPRAKKRRSREAELREIGGDTHVNGDVSGVALRGTISSTPLPSR
ncbi:PQ loop repeat-domain-containing protein [Infundibulicybe gibba]|nr:PQ loop repeat-domain-containing protein [Infundibulicybe gibba]